MSLIMSCLKFICDGVNSCLCKIVFYLYRYIVETVQYRPDDFELDINNFKNSLIQYYDGKMKGVQYSTYTPNYYVKIHTVKDDQHVLWEADNSELKLVIVRYRDDSKYLMCIIDSEDKRYYFMVKDDSWQRIGSKEYFKRIQEMESPTPIKEDIVVNTANTTSNKKFYVSEYKACSTTQHCFFPRPGYRANTVMYKNDKIWESSNNRDKMAAGVLLLSYGEPKLFNMRIEGETNEYLYFKKDYEWVEIGREKFNSISEYYKSWAPFSYIMDRQDTDLDIFKKRLNIKS